MPAADRALVPDVATLYSDHHGWLLGWLRKRLGNAFDAADLTQDTYVRLLGRSGAEIQAIREPRALLMTIAQGLAANLYRKRCVEQAYLDALALMPEAVAQSPSTAPSCCRPWSRWTACWLCSHCPCARPFCCRRSTA